MKDQYKKQTHDYPSSRTISIEKRYPMYCSARRKQRYVLGESDFFVLLGLCHCCYFSICMRVQRGGGFIDCLSGGFINFLYIYLFYVRAQRLMLDPQKSRVDGVPWASFLPGLYQVS